MTSLPRIPEDLFYDPYDAEIDRNPHPTWARLREEAPLYYNEKHGFYALSRYDDVHHGLTNWQDYSSARGTVLENIKPGKLKEGEGNEINLGSMISSDPPAHDIGRRLVQHRFTPKAVRQYEDRARSLARQLLDRVQGKSSFDFLVEIVRPIPPLMIGHLLGVPEADQEDLGHKVDQLMAFDPNSSREEQAAHVLRHGNDIRDYMRTLANERSRSPQDDIITMLINSEVELPDKTTRKLGFGELSSFFLLLQAAGSETTARALGWAAVLLSRHPEQRRKLVDDPAKIVNAVEEIVRYEAPSPIQARLVTRDVEWYGFTVPAGSKLGLLNGSANRDHRKYKDPDKFDVERQKMQHLSFGFGTHACLGANLARLEMRVVLEEMLKRYPEWHVDESQVKLVHTTTVRGPAKVPMQVG